MSLLLNLPIEVGSLILSKWLHPLAVCRLEVAHCAHELRSNLMVLYQYVNTTLQCPSCHSKVNTHLQLQWITKRNVKMSSLTVHEPAFPNSAAQLLIHLIKRSGRYLLDVAIIGNTAAFDSFLQALADHCASLKILWLSDCTFTEKSSSTFCILLRRLGALTELNLQNFLGLKLDCFDGLQCPSITELSFNDDDDMGWECDRMKLVKSCTNLKKYYQCWGVIDLSALPMNLEELNMSFCEIAEVVDDSISFPCVRKLTQTSDIMDESLLRFFPNVTKLDLAHNDGVTLESIALMEDFGSKLTKLTLAYCPNLDEEALTILCAKCKTLEYIDLSSTFLSPDVYADVLDACPLLRSVRFESNELSDEAMFQFARAPITHLSLRNTRGYTEVGIFALLKSTTLEKLALDNALINPLVKLMAKEWCPNLSLCEWFAPED